MYGERGEVFGGCDGRRDEDGWFTYSYGIRREVRG